MTAAPWKVVRIELSESMPDLFFSPEFHGIYALFFWRGVAVGHQEFSAGQLPLTSNQVALSASQAITAAVGDRIFSQGFQSSLPGLPEQALEHPASTLCELLAMNRPLDRLSDLLSQTLNTCRASSGATISVAVCTRERPLELARCIESVLACSATPLEIIVIDNAPETDATLQLMSRFPQLRYHQEPRKGLSAARNAALAIAEGDIVAFVDDDVIVSPNWIANLPESFADPRVMVVTGLILPAELDTQAQIMFEKLQYFHQGYRARYFDSSFFSALKHEGVPVWLLGAGANMAVRREAFVRGYRFNTQLGPGVFGGCGEDSAFWYTLLADGWACAYDPAVMVYHYHRRDLKDLRLQMRQYMQGHVAALLLQFFTHQHQGNLKRLFLVLPRMYLIILQRFLLSGFSPESGIVLSGLRGYFSGLQFAFLYKRTP